MRIERIEKSKHKQERVLVFLEGGDLLRITGADLLRFGLYKGMDLSPALVVELQAAAQQSQLKQTAARMASGRMLSKKEVQHRLTKKGATEEQAADTVLRSALSVRQTEQLAKRLQAAWEKPPEKKPSPAVDYVAEAERELSSRLGRACRIAHGKKKGRVEIEYYGVDDLNDLLEALGKLGK